MATPPDLGSGELVRSSRTYSTNIVVMRKGNKQNAFLNGEWAAHMRKWGKFFTAKARRTVDKKVIREELKNA